MIEISNSGNLDFQYFQIFAVEMPEKVSGIATTSSSLKNSEKSSVEMPEKVSGIATRGG